MEEFNWENFDKIYDKKILPELERFESRRKELLTICLVILFVAIAITGGLFYWICHLDEANVIMQYIIGTLLFLPLAGAIFLVKIFIDTYISDIKYSFYKDLFESLNFKYSNFLRDSWSVCNVCEKSKIFRKFDGVDTDDMVIGKYNKLNFSVIDTFIYENVRTKYGTFKSRIFKGIVLQTKINKPLNCDILIKQDSLFKGTKIGDKERVKLESIEFEEMFEVYSDDQIEARYILTPSFMQRLMNYQNSLWGETVEVYLSNKIQEKYNVFFFIRTNKNNFEVPLFKRFTNKRIFYDILKELTDALDVISELKLEQNIGL